MCNHLIVIVLLLSCTYYFTLIFFLLCQDDTEKELGVNWPPCINRDYEWISAVQQDTTSQLMLHHYICCLTGAISAALWQTSLLWSDITPYYYMVIIRLFFPTYVMCVIISVALGQLRSTESIHNEVIQLFSRLLEPEGFWFAVPLKSESYWPIMRVKAP